MDYTPVWAMADFVFPRDGGSRTKGRRLCPPPEALLRPSRCLLSLPFVARYDASAQLASGCWWCCAISLDGADTWGGVDVVVPFSISLVRAGLLTGTDLECAELPAELKHITRRRRRK